MLVCDVCGLAGHEEAFEAAILVDGRCPRCGRELVSMPLRLPVAGAHESAGLAESLEERLTALAN